MAPTARFLAAGLAVLLVSCSAGDDEDVRPADTGTPAGSVVTTPAQGAVELPATTSAPETTTTTLPAWSEELTRPFLAECSLVVDASACRCVLDGARATVTEERFATWATELARSGGIDPALGRLVDACAVAP